MFLDGTFRTRVIPQFYPRALELRAKYDDFFNNSARHDRSHFCWNPWYIPDHYYYFRAYTADIIGLELADDFNAHLRLLATTELGLTDVSGSFMSFYNNGCHQTTHSDCFNGTYGWVYSLTNWHNRKFSGGETMVARENVFDQLNPRAHKGQTSYWEPFPAHFGQLLIFDDRIAHHVPVIQGPNDPMEARVVMHGHLF